MVFGNKVWKTTNKNRVNKFNSLEEDLWKDFSMQKLIGWFLTHFDQALLVKI